MITFSRLGSHGQLGNQLFQYAMLVGVGAMHSYEIRIPQHLNKRKKFGLYELDKFRISSDRLRITDRRHFTNRYHESGFGFDPGVFEQPDWTDFTGYYQTDKYFAHCEDLVRKEFRFVESIDNYARSYIEDHKVPGAAIVAIHVRRGDYLNRPDLFQVLSEDYYNKAILTPGIPDGRQYFIFSDDMNWCRSTFRWDQVTFVGSPSHWHDMAIMTYCDVYIMAASTFSWWAAWLSHTRNPIVVAPTPWFPAGPRQHYNMSDIIPERWTKQEVK